MKTYDGKNCLITGASSGIGRALAKALAANGARVGVTARREDRLRELVDEIRRAGGIAEYAAADIENREAALAACRSLAERLGPIDLVIANAGVALPTGAAPMNMPNVETMIRVNFLGAAYAFESVMDSMTQRRTGHLVGISSMAAYKGLPGAAGYCASKAALATYCEALRIELYGSGVGVTCVFPGFVETAMTSENKHPMPFMMNAESAAESILRGIRRQPAVYDFPKRMRLLMWLAKWAPDRFMAKRVPIRVASTTNERTTS